MTKATLFEYFIKLILEVGELEEELTDLQRAENEIRLLRETVPNGTNAYLRLTSTINGLLSDCGQISRKINRKNRILDNIEIVLKEDEPCLQKD